MSYSIDANLLLYASNSSCSEHPESADTDFRKFHFLEVVNPLVTSG